MENSKQNFLEWIGDEGFEGFSLSSKIIIVIVQDLLQTPWEDTSEQGLKELKLKIAEQLLTYSKLPVSAVNITFDQESNHINGEVLTNEQKVIQFVFKQSK